MNRILKSDAFSTMEFLLNFHPVNWPDSLHLFQSMSVPVHCCPASRKWTPYPTTVNKKSQDCLLIMYPVKKEATTHTWKSWFSCKIISLHYGPTLHKQFPYTMLAQIDPDKIADFFSVQSCLWAVCQHCKGNVLVQCWLREIKTTLYSLFSCKNMSVHLLGQNFTSIFLCAMLS